MAEAYLIKDALFTFYLSEENNQKVRRIDLYYIHNHYNFTPVDVGKKSDVSLTSKLLEIFSDEKMETAKQLHLILTNRSGIAGGSYFAILDRVQVELRSTVFRNMLISLGDQMQLKVELRHPEVELASADPPSPTTTAILKWHDTSNQIIYSGNTDKFPRRWVKYWNTSLKMKFSVRVSLIVFGNLVLKRYNDLDDMLKEALHLEDEKEFIPKKLLEEKIGTDIIIMTPDGSKIECHKNFLVAQSAVFLTMLTGGRYKEGESREIEIADMSEKGVKALLAFLYYRGLEEPSKDPKVALELIRAANKYDISSLEKATTALILQKPIEWFDISTTIQLFFFSKNIQQLVGVKLKALLILKSKIAELTASNEYQQLFEDVDDVKRVAARELSTALLNM